MRERGRTWTNTGKFVVLTSLRSEPMGTIRGSKISGLARAYSFTGRGIDLEMLLKTVGVFLSAESGGGRMKGWRGREGHSVPSTWVVLAWIKNVNFPPRGRVWRQVLAAPTLKTVWPWSWFSLLAAKSADPFFLVQFSSYKYIFPPLRPWPSLSFPLLSL